MSEFSAGVKILLERMKSNPEDFEEIDRDVIRGIHVRGRFYEFAGSMERMILGDKGTPWRDWYYFTEEERQALIDGFKEMKRVKFDGGIMERVFDEEYVERQREEMRRYHQPQSSPPSMYHPQQNMAAQQARNFATNNTGGGFDLGGFFK
jgi:hypothetical protein